jgi:hypothetical protein
VRDRHGRRGQILFLEFVFTLPIFGLLLIMMTAFHVYYLRTAVQQGQARRAAWRESLSHITRKPSLGTVAKISAVEEGDILQEPGTPVNSEVAKRKYIAIASRMTTVPFFRMDVPAVGRVEVNQDPWADEELQAKDARIHGQQKRKRTLPTFTPDGSTDDAVKNRIDWQFKVGKELAGDGSVGRATRDAYANVGSLAGDGPETFGAGAILYDAASGLTPKQKGLLNL